jgi:hypothetical protein
MRFGGRKDPPEQHSEKDKKDKKRDHRIRGDPFYILHIIFNEFQHDLFVF